MNKFKFYFIVITASFLFFSCSKKDDDVTIEPPVDFAVQYPIDIAIIKDYLTTHYLDMDLTNPNFADNDVVIKKIDNGQASIMSYLNASTYPKLLIRPVKLQNVEYELYYLVLRPGVGTAPCNVDGVLTSYNGEYLSRDASSKALSATKFEEVVFPQSILSLYNVITGWSEIFPQFKTGTSEINANGTVTHKDFGAGVMFIPSGLAYYNTGKGAIPAYSPLVFSFKLYEIQRLDQDSDGIPSYQEDYNGDGYMRVLETGVDNPDDFPDKDGIPNFLDVDDDGDNYTTKLETKRPDLLVNGVSVSNGYYPFDGAKDANGNPLDDPATTNINEGEGIPEYSAAGTPDYTTATRKRIHLDKEHHTAKP